jgi:hypothetical protein
MRAIYLMQRTIHRGWIVPKTGMVAASSTTLTALTVKMDAHTKNEGAEVDLIGEGTWNLICFVC